MIIDDKLTIFYFSGTGNAKAVAKWIIEVAESQNINSELVNIASLENRNSFNMPENSTIGICAPTHGFNFPPIVLNFIARFPKGHSNKLFLINTRAGMKIGKRFIPGLSGVALLFSSILLKLKRYEIIGLRSIDLPSNWLSLHPGLKSNVVDSIFLKREKDSKIFANQILNNKSNYRALRDIIQDLLLTPIAIMYYIFARFIFAKTFIASKSCDHCKLCIRKCPVNAIKEIDKRCYWTYKCESCMQCMNICPKRSIQTAHGFIFGIALIVYLFLLGWLYSVLPIIDFINTFSSGFGNRLLILLFNSAIFLTATFVFYRIMHYLMRYRVFERIFTLSSLTNYTFWRRYKPIKK